MQYTQARTDACDPHRYALTGTPMSNSYTELWSLFDFVSGGRVGERKDFKEYYTKELYAGLRKSAKQHEIAARVAKQRSLKARAPHPIVWQLLLGQLEASSGPRLLFVLA